MSIFILNLSLVYAVECGPVPSDGCYINVNTTFNPETYNLPSGIRFNKSNVVLDCNGATLIGPGTHSGSGVHSNKFDNLEIKNCNIENFHFGISLHQSDNGIIASNTIRYNLHGIEIDDYSDYNNIHNNNFQNNDKNIYFNSYKHPPKYNVVYSNDFDGGIYGLYSECYSYDWHKYCPLYNSIKNNTFTNLDYGVYFSGTEYPTYFNITGNEFSNNNIHDLYLGTQKNTISDNTFDGAGVRTKYTSNKYCDDGIGNTYIGDTFGQPCDCWIPEPSLYVDAPTDLCYGTYINATMNIIGSYNSIDCHNATLIGPGLYGWKGISLSHADNAEIKNCNIENYDTGIYIYDYSDYNNIYDNNFQNNDKNIYFNSYKHPPKYNVISSNDFDSGTYGIYSECYSYDGHKYCPLYNSIKNNTFTNLDYGVYFSGIEYPTYFNVTGNEFLNNNIYDLYLGTQKNTISDNTFDGAGVRTRYTSNKYCDDGIGNTYIGNTFGQTCNCWIPERGLNVDAPTDLCYGTYNNVTLTIVESNNYLDCHNATIIGPGSWTAISFQSYVDNSQVKNCNIENYDNGIYVSSYSNYNIIFSNTLRDNNRGVHIYVSDYNQIYDNNFLNNNINTYLSSSRSYGPDYNYIYSNRFNGGTIGVSSGCYEHRCPRYNIIKNNNFTNHKYGVYTSDLINPTYFNISGNEFTSNYRGISLGSNNNNIFSNNFNYNNYSIYNFGCDHSITDNKFNNSINYSFYHQNICNQSAEYNYWGTNSATIISESIYDYYDNPSYGIVDFEPYLIEPFENCRNGTLNIVTSTNGLNVYINSYYEGKTDYSYSLQKEFNKDDCWDFYNVDIYCQDNVTLCYSETAYISHDGETVTVLESDCVKTCSNDANLWLTNRDVKINGNNINVDIHSSNINGDVDITMYRINEETGLIDDTKVLQTNIASHSTSFIPTTWDLTSASALNIYIDKEGNFDEDKSDNFVYRTISKNVPKAYLSINTLYPEVDSLIENHLTQYVNYEDNINNAELIISIGKFTDEFKNANPETLKPSGHFWWKKQGWGYKDYRITAYGKTDSSSYAGIVGGTSYNGKPLVLAYGIKIDGDIASVKKLISARELYFSDISSPEKPPIIIDKYDKLALGVNNLLKRYNNFSSPEFLKVVDKILFDNTYDVAIRTVKTLDTTSYGKSTILRLKNVNSDYSKDFRDAISESDKPVVLARGLWSDLFTWQDFAKELAAEGRDSWLIEITGGPEQDCDTCPNYEYEDLVDYYWPALIAGVEEYSEQNKLDYIGFSNGCRVGLDSLTNWSSTGKNDAGYYFNYDNGEYELTDLSSNPVDTFVGVGCPGAFEGDSPLISAMNKYGSVAINNLESVGNFHPNLIETLRSIRLASPGGANRGGRISLNLLKGYKDFINDSSDSQPGENLVLNSVLIIYGDTPAFSGSDFVVTTNDNLAIYNSITSQNKDLYVTNLNHFTIPNGLNVKKQIKNKINEVN